MCREIYCRAVNGPMNDSVIIHLCYSDFEESFGNHQKCIEIFKKLLTFKDADLSVIYINYMRHLLRTLGIEEVRRVFKNARIDNRVDYRVYVWAAQQEYRIDHNAVVSLKILDLAVKRFPGDLNLLQDFFKHLKCIHGKGFI
ncbi:Protein suppressor of forked [Thelohanellus kitauei]|uniref:Protein suppressor of forked n=1 Tax=Thelohanellus kitauei TaxID=669202 RepID=A0A0C2MGB0_THEKT|nr:Protein suppressor of forked [Thelohanellus kitauei]